MHVEYGTACATSESGVCNLGGWVRGVRKIGVRISPLPAAGRPPAAGRRRIPVDEVAGGKGMARLCGGGRADGRRGSAEATGRPRRTSLLWTWPRQWQWGTSPRTGRRF